MKSASPSLWFWSLVSLLLAVVVGLEVAWWISMKPAAREQALNSGQRVAYNLTTNEKLGNAEAFLPDGELPISETETPAEGAAETSVPPPAALPIDGKTETAATDASPAVETPKAEEVKAEAPPSVEAEKPVPNIAKPKTPTSVTAVASSALEPPAGAKPVEPAPVVPTTHWQKQAHPYIPPAANAPKQAKISILVTGLGLSKSSTEQALDLPKEVGLILSPYSHNIRSWAEQAKSKGYEVYVELPLEPKNYPLVDPGPNALLTTLDAKDMQTRLDWVLNRTPEYVGLVTPVDEKFTVHADSLEKLKPLLKDKELLLFRSNPENPAPFEKMVSGAGLKAFQAASVLDEKINAETIDAELNALAHEAEKRGYVIAIARPYPVTLGRLSAWAKGLSKKGIELVPASTAGYVGLPASPVAAAASPAPETVKPAEAAKVEEAPKSPAPAPTAGASHATH